MRFPDFSEEQSNPLIQTFAKMKSKGETILDLTQSNPTQAGFIYPREILIHRFAGEFSWKYNPDSQGLLEARKAVQKYYSERNPNPFKNRPMDIDDIFLTSGTSECYTHIFKTLTRPGDEILIQSPGYPLIEVLAQLECLKPIHFTEISEIEKLVSTRTKAICLVQPNNPSGKIFSQEEVQASIDLCERFNLSAIVDEVFADSILDEREIQFFTSDRVPIFTLNGISKIAGLPSWKLAWIHLQEPNSLSGEIHKRLEWICDSYLSPNSISLELLGTILDSRYLIQNQIKKRIRRNLSATDELLSDSLISYQYPNAGWYLELELSDKIYPSSRFHSNKNFIQSSSLNSTSIDPELIAMGILQNKKVFTHPGSLYGYPASKPKLILSLLTEEELYREGINRILEFCF